MSAHLIFLAAIVAFVVGCEQGQVKQTEQFAAQVKSVVKPDELQAWATNIIAKIQVYGGKGSVDIKDADVLNFVRNIYTNAPPEMVEVVGGDSGSYVVICYGSGFGHWGLYVGYPTLRQESNQQFYVVPWKPGIYFWNGP